MAATTNKFASGAILRRARLEKKVERSLRKKGKRQWMMVVGEGRSEGVVGTMVVVQVSSEQTKWRGGFALQ